MLTEFKCRMPFVRELQLLRYKTQTYWHCICNRLHEELSLRVVVWNSVICITAVQIKLWPLTNHAIPEGPVRSCTALWPVRCSVAAVCLCTLHYTLSLTPACGLSIQRLSWVSKRFHRLGEVRKVKAVAARHVVVTTTADERRAMAACCVIRITGSDQYSMIFDHVASRCLV